MELEKLLTFRQFVDEMKLNGIGTEPETIDLIFKYNDLLKQPLTKDMFVNSLEKPDVCNYKLDGEILETYYILLNNWQEAENKVIFEDHMKYFFFEFQRLDSKWLLLNDMTLSDLAKATNGELTLKNVTI